MSAPLLVVEGLRAGYGHVEVLHGISLAVPKGSIVTVIGANGAGKTTLLNALIGLMPARGTIRFDGAAVDGQPLEARIGRGMGLVPERRELFADMSVEDNLQIGGFRRGRVERAETFETVLGRFPRLRERRHQLAGTLSGGERQMLAMGRALMARPQLLLLDEPSLGLAPRIIAQVFEILVELRAAGVSILLIEQNARSALKIADHAYVLELGKVTAEGEPVAMLRDPRLIESYLGLGKNTY